MMMFPREISSLPIDLKMMMRDMELMILARSDARALRHDYY